MREIRQSGSEGGARFYPLSLPLSFEFALGDAVQRSRRFPRGQRNPLEWTDWPCHIRARNLKR